MTETETKKKALPKEVGPIKLRAVQDLFGLDYDEPQSLIREGQVFRYKGTPLSEEVAVEVDPETPLGLPVDTPIHPGDPSRKPPAPSYTTDGFVKAATMAKGAADGGAA